MRKKLFQPNACKCKVAASHKIAQLQASSFKCNVYFLVGGEKKFLIPQQEMLTYDASCSVQTKVR